MTDDNDVYTPAQFREHQDGHGVREPDAHPHAGIVRDEQVSRYLSVLAEEYDPRQQPGAMPGRADQLGEYQRMQSIAATETGRDALQSGDMPTLKHLTGDQQQRADISGMKAIGKIDQIIESPAPVIVILGEMGTGKTDLSGLFGQRAKHLLGIEKVASNIPTLKETNEWTTQDGKQRSGFVPSFPEFSRWVEQDGDPMDNGQSPKLFIGDEFSSVGDGTGKSGYNVRTKMGPLVFKIRKYNGLLIYIAHDASSIHPLLWRLGVIVHKTSKKKAEVADRVKSGEIRDVQFEIDGIPQTDWRYDTKDPAVWSWDGDDDLEDDTPEPGDVAYDVAVWTAIEAEKEGLSTRETAKFVPFSHQWVADRREEHKNGTDHSDRLDRVEEITA